MNPLGHVDDILDAWRLRGRGSQRRPKAASKPRRSSCHAPAGSSSYASKRTSSSRRFEHELLQKLALADLSFGVPRPVPSDDGETLRVVDGRLAVHALGRQNVASLATFDDVRPRASLFTQEWVQKNGGELARRAIGWIGERV